MRIVELILQRIFAVSEKLERVTKHTENSPKRTLKKNSPKTYTVKEKFTENVHCEEPFAQKHKKDTRTMKRSDGVSLI